MGSKCSLYICDMIAFEVMEDSLTKFGNRNKMVFKWRYRNDIFVLTYNGTLCNYNSIQIQNCIVIKQYNLWQLYKLSYPLLKFIYEKFSDWNDILDTRFIEGFSCQYDSVQSFINICTDRLNVVFGGVFLQSKQ